MKDLKSIRSQLMNAAAIIIALKVIVWAVMPYLGYIISAVVVITAIGLILYRTIKF